MARRIPRVACPALLFTPVADDVMAAVGYNIQSENSDSPDWTALEESQDLTP